MARVTLALAVVASLTIAAPSAARAATGCRVPGGAQVNARNAHAVVYTVELPEHGAGRSRSFMGCVEAVGGPFEIEHLERDGGRVVRWRASGRSRERDLG